MKYLWDERGLYTIRKLDGSAFGADEDIRPLRHRPLPQVRLQCDLLVMAGRDDAEALLAPEG